MPMQRSPWSPFLFASLTALLAACSKDDPPTAAQPAEGAKPAGEAPAAEPEKPASEKSAPENPATEPGQPAAPAEKAPAKDGDTGAAETGKPAEVAAAGAGEEPAGEGAAAEGKQPAGDEAAAEGKKPSKKKAGDKAEEAPAKEAKPKFAELGVKVTKAGSGTAATDGRTVTLHYKATVADAEKPFDSTFAMHRPIEVRLGAGAKLAVIEGLRRGLEGLTPGSEARLEIPANLAWGEKGNPAVGVPANSDVVFEIQVIDVQ
jgi:FK506-binding nuclear protein